MFTCRMETTNPVSHCSLRQLLNHLGAREFGARMLAIPDFSERSFLRTCPMWDDLWTLEPAFGATSALYNKYCFYNQIRTVAISGGLWP